MNSRLFVHNPIWNGQALQLLQELSSLCYFWMYTSMQLFVTLLLYIYNIRKKLTDQITIICLVCILVLNDLNALLTDSQKYKGLYNQCLLHCLLF